MSTAEISQEVNLFEKGVLAAVIDDAEVAGVVAEIIEPTDFSEPRHEIIFSKILQFYREGKPFDALHMAQSIADDGNLSHVGGFPYFMEILDVDAVYANADPVTYALTVREYSQRRALRLVGEKIKEGTRTGSGMNSDDIVAYMHSNVRQFSERSFNKGYVKLGDFIDDTFEELENAIINGVTDETAIPTGFLDVDDRVGGMFPGQMIIVAGRPGSGKTTLALDFARNAALLADKTVLFFSLEMGKEELMHKLLAAEAHVKHEKLRLGQELTDPEWEKLKIAKRKFADSNFYVDDNPVLDLVALQAKCQKQAARPEGLDLVIIDYLQLMQAPSGKGSREQEIAEISRNIKLMAKTIGVPIIILAQLNRGNTNRTDKKPVVSDLRESGSLEQDADMVFLVHRPEDFDPNDKPGVTEIIIGKVRAGRAGTVDVLTLLEYSKFGNLAGRYPATEPPVEEVPPEPEEDVFSEDFPDTDQGQRYADEPRYDNVPPPEEPEDAFSGAGNVSEPEAGGEAW